MKNLIKLLMIISVMIFAGIQNMYGQTYFRIAFQAPCYDECTTQEHCIYKFSYILIDQCGTNDTTICSGSYDVKCEDIPPYYKDIVCPSCTEATHDPCFLVGGMVQKICVGPGGSHVICEGTKAEYHTCQELSSYPGPTITVEWQ